MSEDSRQRIAQANTHMTQVLTSEPFDHSKWVEAQTKLIVEDVPWLIAEAATCRYMVEEIRRFAEEALGARGLDLIAFMDEMDSNAAPTP